MLRQQLAQLARSSRSRWLLRGSPCLLTQTRVFSIARLSSAPHLHQTHVAAPSASVLRYMSSVAQAVAVEKEPEQEEVKEPVAATFDDFHDIPVKIRQNLANVFRYKHPTAGQEAVLRKLPVKGDLLVRAKTGTGKTLSFLIAAHEVISRKQDSANPEMSPADLSILVLSPTRELASQIQTEERRLVQRLRHQSYAFLGGEPKSRQLMAIDRGDLGTVVATPGRMIDLLHSSERFRKQVSEVSVLVLDEADMLLDLGFRDDIEEIVSYLPKKRHTFLVSATLSKKIKDMCAFAFTNQIDFVDTISPNDVSTHQRVQQSYVVAPQKDHPGMLLNVIRDHFKRKPDGRIMVFVPTTAACRMYARLFSTLYSHTMEIHSKIEQRRRKHISDRFRRTPGSVLFTSDVSARGVDYPNVTLVVQLNVPPTRDSYIHRIGRTARAGNDGEALIVLNEQEVPFLKRMSDLPIQQNEKYTTLLKQALPHDQDLYNARRSVNDELRYDAASSLVAFYASNGHNFRIHADSCVHEAQSFFEAIGGSPSLRISNNSGGGGQRSSRSRGGDRFSRDSSRGGSRGFGGAERDFDFPELRGDARGRGQPNTIRMRSFNDNDYEPRSNRSSSGRGSRSHFKEERREKRFSTPGGRYPRRGARDDGW